jgi:thiamine-phosphate pyrophosphorylase
MNPVDLRLYGIIDPERIGDRDPVDLVRQAAAGGTTLIQYRDKHADGRRMVELARALKAALARTNVPLLVNDRIDVALAAGADGVHLGQDDLDPADARRLMGERTIIGLTLKTEEEAEAFARRPVDYGCIGGVFATASKVNPSPPIGPDRLGALVIRAKRQSRCPVGAIAGIDASNAADVIAAGADGIAVISALFAMPDPPAGARRLRQIVDRALAEREAAA